MFGSSKLLDRLLIVGAVCLLAPVSAQALPWDYDMYRQQSLEANEVSRSPVEGTVPLGYKPFTLTLEEAEKSLTNPVSATRDSVWRGQRLYNANCYTCHGKTAAGDGPVGPQVGVPDLRKDFYREKTDGRIFGVIHYGLRAMPRYGFKFSDAEQWDIVNYLRFLQGKDVDGMKRPGKEQ